MRRIGLFGGSFNPVHIGHILVAQTAVEELELDRVFFIPAAQSPFKPDHRLASGSERARLLRLALVGRSWSEVDEQEIARGGISYTIETVRAYRVRFPGVRLFYLIGSDHLRFLSAWRNSEELARQVDFAVFVRPGEPVVPIPPPFSGVTIEAFEMGVSASQVRERVQLGLPIDFLVPPQVAEAIRNNRLYL